MRVLLGRRLVITTQQAHSPLRPISHTQLPHTFAPTRPSSSHRRASLHTHCCLSVTYTSPSMPEHAEVFAHCPNVVKEYVSPPPGAHHTSLYTNQIVEEIHARHAREALEAQAQVYATTYHQPPQASSRMQSRAPSRVQSPSYSYQAYRPPRPSSGFEVREREVMEDGWEMRGVEGECGLSYQGHFFGVGSSSRVLRVGTQVVDCEVSDKGT